MRKSISDKELVKRFQGGDELAFEILVERYHQQIFRMASVLLIVPDHSADVTQEVFLRAYKGLPRFRFQAEPYTWLFRTMKNVCKEINRKERFDTEEMDTQCSGESLEVRLENRSKLAAVRALLEGLPERQREVVLLRIFEEKSVKETAQVMGCRAGTIKALLHKALSKIRKSLDENEN